MKLLVRPPSPLLEQGSLVYLDPSEVDFPLAQRQWDTYVETFRSNGWEIVEVPESPELPDGVFIEDTVVMYGTTAVISRPGTASRVDEPVAVAPVLESLGYDMHHITAPATLEGGDILKVGTTVYVGISTGTNQEGADQLAAILEPLGATVVSIPMTKALHLKSAITALPDETIIGWTDIVDDPSMFPSYIGVPEEPGCHVVIVGDNTLVMSSAAPESAHLLEEKGYRVIRVDVTEFEKLEGCVTCLSVRLRH